MVGCEDAVEPAIFGGAHLLYRIVERVGGLQVGGEVGVDLNAKIKDGSVAS